MLFQRCSQYLLPSGATAPLDAEALAAFSTVQRDFASQGQRVLLLAKKQVSASAISATALREEDQLLALAVDLVVVGLAALEDPPKSDTRETVRVCRGAGIRFMMVTGDFALTAASIAAQCGIISDLGKVKHLSDLSVSHSCIAALRSNDQGALQSSRNVCRTICLNQHGGGRSRPRSNLARPFGTRAHDDVGRSMEASAAGELLRSQMSNLGSLTRAGDSLTRSSLREQARSRSSRSSRRIKRRTKRSLSPVMEVRLSPS